MGVNRCSFDFAGASVLVTGGSGGIGHAVASAFADAGASVTVTGTRASAGDYADVDLARFEFASVDTRDAEAIDELVARFEVLDVLVNNAGATFAGGLDEWTPEGFAAAVDLNLAGAFRLTVGLREALAASDLPGGASVVSIASMASFRAVPIVPGYSAAKAGLVATTRNLALAWADHGIRVNAVAPGVISTRMTAPLELPELVEMKDKELAHVPAGRMGTPEECAGAVLFLASSASAYTTGITLPVDGGYLAF